MSIGITAVEGVAIGPAEREADTLEQSPQRVLIADPAARRGVGVIDGCDR